MPAIGSDQQHYQQLNHTITTHRPVPLLHLPTDHDVPLAVSSHLSSSSSSSPSPTPSSIASIILSNFLPSDSIVATTDAQYRLHRPSTISPPSIENLVVANSAEDLSNFRDVTFDLFDEDDDLFGSPLAFDGSENGLWNGHFVPPPPRPPFFVDEPVLSDGLTTCDLCSWAMPTKSTFIFEGTIEKASELGWPLTLIIVSILSALLGAIIMITVVRCKRKKTSNNRNETHVQWWSRNKRPNNNNHLRRSNIYTAHPADSIRGLQQPTLSASSSLTAMTAMGVAPATTGISAASSTGTSQQYFQRQQQQQHHPFQQQQQQEYEHEYHQPQELQLHIQQQQKQQQHQHQRQLSSSISSDSTTSTPSLTTTISTTMMPLPTQLQHQQQLSSSQQQHDACNWSNGVTIIGAS